MPNEDDVEVFLALFCQGSVGECLSDLVHLSGWLRSVSVFGMECRVECRVECSLNKLP